MPPSSSNPQVGRQIWATIRDAVDVSSLWSKLPVRVHFVGHRLGAQAARSLHRTSSRSFHTSRTARGPTPPLPARFAPGNVRHSCTSGGLLLLGLGTPSANPTQTIVASCTTAAVDSALLASGTGAKANIRLLARQAWRRSIHTDRGGDASGKGVRDAIRDGNSKSPAPARESPKNPTDGSTKGTSSTTPAPNPETDPSAAPESLTDSMSKYLHLPHLPHLPKMPHRPTKEELLAAATGFWQRLKVRFKWLSIRSMRPYNADEWGAFVSWFMLGHLVWILVGTTTFFSLIIFLVNTVFAQETLAKWIGDYLTKSAGVTVVFESAIVPKWKDGVITFRNVFISRRPGQIKSSVKKGSPISAAAVAAARQNQSDIQTTEEDDGNYTQFDVTINTVNVTLSFYKWWNGTGLLKDVEVKGVRGVVDRTSVQWSDHPVDPLSYRHVHQPGDFEIEHFKLEDLLVTVHQPGGFRPFPVSIYSCELPQLRKQWLFHDFLYANHCSGSFDGSLFTIHPRQIHGIHTGDASAHIGEPGAWKKFSRIRIDGLKIDHLNRGVEGPFGWIYEGNVDIVSDLMFPADEDDSLGKVMSDFYEKMEDAVTKNRFYERMEDAVARNRYLRILDQHRQAGSKPEKPPVVAEDSRGHVSDYTTADSDFGPSSPRPAQPPALTGTNTDDDAHPPRYLVMDLRIHLNDVRAAVPLFTHSISYISQPLVRPIVAYINAKRTYIPISCRIVKPVSDFDGAWTTYDSGMMDDLSAEVYEAFARDVEDQHSRVRRLKKVGFWTLSMIVHALLAGVAGDLI